MHRHRYCSITGGAVRVVFRGEYSLTGPSSVQLWTDLGALPDAAGIEALIHEARMALDALAVRAGFAEAGAVWYTDTRFSQ